jgi:hypothetical protein
VAVRIGQERDGFSADAAGLLDDLTAEGTYMCHDPGHVVDREGQVLGGMRHRNEAGFLPELDACGHAGGRHLDDHPLIHLVADDLLEFQRGGVERGRPGHIGDVEANVIQADRKRGHETLPFNDGFELVVRTICGDSGYRGSGCPVP